MVAFIATELTVEYPLIRLRVVAKRNVWLSAVLISVYGFGVTATSFVLPDYLTRVQSARSANRRCAELGSTSAIHLCTARRNPAAPH